jgi:hypothetical protein
MEGVARQVEDKSRQLHQSALKFEKSALITSLE